MRTIKHCLILLLLVVFSITSKATHFAGYDMNITYLNNGTYKVTLRLFKDLNGAAGMPGSVSFKTFVNVTNTDANVNFTANRVQLFTQQYDPKECPPPGANLTLQVGIFEYTLTLAQVALLTNPNGYYFSSDDCCRNAGATNVPNSDGAGMTWTMDFPALSNTSTYKFNNSPRFLKAPLAFYCIGKPYTVDWECRDPDGDSLVYYLIPPSDWGSDTKPFPVLQYNPGYNLNYNILDGTPDLTINRKTGIINFIPTRMGTYLVGFKVDEYRNGVLIGSIIREFQLETVLCPEAPPVTEDQNNQTRYIVDTINYGDDIKLTFTSRDSPNDSLFMSIIPNILQGENVLDANLFGAKWGKVGQPLGDPAAQQLIIEDQGIVIGEFIWKPRCEHVRPKPYTFQVVVRDKTCPSPFSDTTYVTLFVQKKDNIEPMFVNKYLGKPDTIYKSTPANKKIRRYYIKAGDTFELSGDSVVKTYDKDSTQVVNIRVTPDPANGTLVNNAVQGGDYPLPVHSTYIFKLPTTCEFNVDEPLRFKFEAWDDDCLRPDTIDFSIEVYVKDQPNRKPLYAANNPDSVKIPEGQTLSFTITIYDTVANVNINKYKNITLYPDVSDFTNMQLLGGNQITFTSLTSNDSLKVTFTWSPNCANVRQEPYKLYLRTSDDGCPTINAYDTVYVFALGPYNSAPEFRDKDDNTITVIDTTIYGGEVFRFNLFAVDTNTRFDSVFVSLDNTSEIADPSIVDNIAFVLPVQGKDSARTELIWNTTCADIRTTPYTAKVIARDNECVNPEVSNLIFNITVRERPNYVPKFTFTNTLVTIDTVYAGETYVLNLTSVDTTINEYITIDTVFTNIPFNQPKPVISRAYGLGSDTVETDLNWFIDCSLIRDEPYTIKVASWDGACRNPQDSARHEFVIYVLRNPLLTPNFTMGGDTTIELVAGEKFSLQLNSKSDMPGDSVLITSTGDVYGGIPGNLANFELTSVQGEGNATFTWETSCDQIRDSTYNVFFTTSNPPCKTPEETFVIKFKIIPNLDLTNKIPNVFTPNGDKVNDVYRINKQYKVYCDPGFKFTIFNRWGKVVFESTNPDFEWDAKDLGAGTYFYSLESRARSQSGTIDLIK